MPSAPAPVFSTGSPPAVRIRDPRPSILGWVTTAVIVTAPFLFGCVEPWSRAVLELECFGLGVACLAGKQFEMDEVPVLCVGFLAVAAVGALQSLHVSYPQEPAASLSTVSRWASLREARLWAAYASLALAASESLRGREARRAWTWILVAAGSVFSIVGIVQRLSESGFILGLRPIPKGAMPFGPYYNRDHAAGLLAMLFALGSGLFASRFFSYRGRWRIGDLANFGAIQALILAGLMAMGGALLMISSRGAMWALALGAWAVLYTAAPRFFPPSRQRASRLFLLLLLPGSLALLLADPRRLGLVGGAFDLSTRIRLSAWRGSLRMIQERPWLGHGLGAFREAFRSYQETWIYGVVDHAHSDWLELVACVGLVGFSAFAIGLFVHLRDGFRHGLNALDREQRCLTAGALAACLAFVLHSLVDFNLQIPASAVVFIAAACVAGGRVGFRAPPALRKPLACAALAGLSLGAALSGASLRAWSWAVRADAAPLRGKPSLLSRALRWDPHNPAYREALGATYLWLGRETPTANRLLAQDALREAEQGLADAPLNSGLRAVAAESLKVLDRGADAAAEERRAALGDPWKALK